LLPGCGDSPTRQSDGPGDGDTPQTAAFADTALETAVRRALATPEGSLDTVALVGLTTLSARSQGIEALTGIEALHGLQALDLEENRISDLSPLASLGSLAMLDLAGNQVRDLAPLAGLTRLSYLELSDNLVSDLSPLAGLRQLEYLALSRNAVQDLAPLLGLLQLQSVELTGNPLGAESQGQHLRALAWRGVQVVCAECAASGDTGGASTDQDRWRIAFLTNRDGNREIYAMDTDGGDPANVSRTPWNEVAYAWSPDGTLIAYTRDQFEDTGKVYLYDWLGNTDTIVPVEGLSTPAYPSWLPDGRRLAIGYAGGGVMVLFDTIEQRADTLQWSGWYPTWSPDGTRVAYLSNERASVTRGMDALWIRNADGTDARFLTNGAYWDSPVWSPDGTQIAFCGQPGGDLEIYAIKADGSDLRRLTRHPGMDWGPAWSPDGARIVYASYSAGNAEICVMAADGGTPTNLTQNPAIDTEPRWVRWWGGF
jgi:Tol biopolymer transport system component